MNAALRSYRLPTFQEIARWRLPTLAFDPETEQRFLLSGAPERLHHLVRSGMVALAVYILFLPADWLLVPDVFDLALTVRLFVFTPLAVLLLLVGWRLRRMVLLLPDFVIELLITVIALLAAASLGYILVQSHSPLAMLYRAGVCPVLIFGNLVHRLRFRYAVAFSIGVIAIYGISTALMPPPAAELAPLEMPMAMMVTTMAVYTLVSNFRTEYDERQRFVRVERAQSLSEQLRVSHEQLREMSRRDPLTGVANRRHFDDFMREQWERLAEHDRPLALLLIDVDHFKAYNDRHGHPAGDECLRHVARVVRRIAAARPGLAARWGGEEFAVVLPDANLGEAMELAQGLREAVAGLGLRHEGSPTAPSVTVSIGVAAVSPRHSPNPPESLVAAADVALYRAKADGRNRCVAHPSLVPAPGYRPA